jgi:hypothetical protein
MLSLEKGTPQEEVDKYFIRMCFFADFEYIKYLLTSPEIDLHANVHANNDKGFANLIEDLPKAQQADCRDRTTEIIHYLIFDFNIEKTPAIEEILKSRGELAEPYRKMFETRELNNSLSNELEINPGKIKGNKI